MTDQYASIRHVFAEFRRTLTTVGVVSGDPTVRTVAMRDQAQAAYRRDLLEAGVDPTAEHIVASLAGVAESAKMLLMIGDLPVPVRFYLVAQLVDLAETVMGDEAADASDAVCSQCLQPTTDGSGLCERCQAAAAAAAAAARQWPSGRRYGVLGGLGAPVPEPVEPTPEVDEVPRRWWQRRRG